MRSFMKNIILIIVAPFVFLTALTAQITQQQADSIVMEHLSSETRDYSLYTKEGIQMGITITTSAGEALELDYSCWTYYANINFGCYLIVKESNGNLLEINPKSSAKPDDLAEWRILPYECESAQLWDYPVKPGMPEWAELKSRDERVVACQIPENILSCLSTENLIRLCLQYPLFFDVYLFNCLDNGLNALFNNFNGVRELYEREDVLIELLKYYQSIIQDISISNADNVEFNISVSNVELLLSRYQSANKDITEDYKEILRLLTDGYERKIVYADEYIFQSLSFVTNLFSRAKKIIEISPQSVEQISGSVFCGHINKEVMDIINKLSYQLIK